MAQSDFEYVLTIYDAPRSTQGYYWGGYGAEYTYADTTGDNGQPFYIESEDRYVRKYHHKLERSSAGAYDPDYGDCLSIFEKNFVTKAKLREIGVLNENETLNNNKMISVRMRLKISENRAAFSNNTTSAYRPSYYRYFAGITLFSERSANLLDYRENPEDKRKFSYSNRPTNWPEYTEVSKYFSGYNLLLSSDGRGVKGWRHGYTLTDSGWINANLEQNHLSLYGFGSNTPSFELFKSDDTKSASFAFNSDLWKLHQATQLTGQQGYEIDSWYSIRLDYIPITETSHKLVSYAAKDGDLVWTKTGETIHYESDEKFTKTGDIGFVVCTVTSGLKNLSYSNAAYYDPISNNSYDIFYRLNTTTYIDKFEIYTQDIQQV